MVDLYIVDVFYKYLIQKYVVYEPFSDSIMMLYKDDLLSLVCNKNVNIVNANIKGSDIVFSDWVYKILDRREKFNDFVNNKDKIGYVIVLFADTNLNNEERYYVISNKWALYTITKEELLYYINEDIVVNCSLKGGKIVIQDSYRCRRLSLEEKRNLYERVNNWILKTRLLNMGIDINLAVIGDNVILKKYRSNRDEVVLPNFITSISRNVFDVDSIKKLILNDNLKYIGSRAFIKTYVHFVNVPKNLRYIGKEVFGTLWDDLFEKEVFGTLWDDLFKEKAALLNSNTVIVN